MDMQVFKLAGLASSVTGSRKETNHRAASSALARLSWLGGGSTVSMENEPGVIQRDMTCAGAVSWA